MYIIVVHSKDFTIIIAVEAINFTNFSNFNFTKLIIKYSN